MEIGIFGRYGSEDFKGISYGSELIVNGVFNDATGWILGAGWTISGGLLNGSAINYIMASILAGLVKGKKYCIECDVVVTSGGLVFNLGGSQTTAPSITSSGHKKITHLLTVVSNGRFYAEPYSTFTGTIDNLSVREVIGDMGESSVGDPVELI